MNRSFLLSAVFLTIGLSAMQPARAAIVTTSYSGFGHSGAAEQPAVGTTFNSGNIVTDGMTSWSHSDSVATSDGFATTVRSLTVAASGSGTNSYSISSNLESVSNVTGSGDNKQVSSTNYQYIGFQVDQTGIYNISAALAMRSASASTGYHYFGLGGSFELAQNNDPNPNDVLIFVDTGNIADPMADTTVFSLSQNVTLTAGVQYQLNFNNYLYSGFNDPGVATANGGWNVSVTAVPEPSTIGLLAVTATGCLLRRRRIRQIH